MHNPLTQQKFFYLQCYQLFMSFFIYAPYFAYILLFLNSCNRILIQDSFLYEPTEKAM